MRRFGLLLSALLLPFLIVRDAPADIGRSGGIVILPCAIAIANCGQQLRTQYEFPVGTDVALGLPSNLGPNVLVAVEMDGCLGAFCGRLENGMLILRGTELRALRSAGVQSLRITLADGQQRGLLLRLSFKSDVEEIQVW